ncbi:MAG: hypothetical protein IKU19_03200 [Clostridia bacterium]|nr:hypothetical protein [Clostridia bacterium]
MIEYRVCIGRCGYGIEALENGEAVNRADDLFESESEAEKFAKLCTVLELSPIHLEDVSEDILFVRKAN